MPETWVSISNYYRNHNRTYQRQNLAYHKRRKHSENAPSERCVEIAMRTTVAGTATTGTVVSTRTAVRIVASADGDGNLVPPEIVMLPKVIRRLKIGRTVIRLPVVL